MRLSRLAKFDLKRRSIKANTRGSRVKRSRRVNGSHAHPLYNYLKREKSGLLGSSVKWNFTKFLVDRSGKVVARHAPTAKPEGLKTEIEALL